MNLDFLKLQPDARPPIRALPESAAFDIHAYLKTESGRPSKRMVSVRCTVVIPTGIAVRPPNKHVVLVCSRSGYATKSLFVANSPGVVDPDYTGEIKVLLYNGGYEPYYVEHEDRIAQLLVVPFPILALHEASSFPETVRGASGFGSTGR